MISFIIEWLPIFTPPMLIVLGVLFFMFGIRQDGDKSDT